VNPGNGQPAIAEAAFRAGMDVESKFLARLTKTDRSTLVKLLRKLVLSVDSESSAD
jgi:hypothetical protein